MKIKYMIQHEFCEKSVEENKYKSYTQIMLSKESKQIKLIQIIFEYLQMMKNIIKQ